MVLSRLARREMLRSARRWGMIPFDAALRGLEGRAELLHYRAHSVANVAVALSEPLRLADSLQC